MQQHGFPCGPCLTFKGAQLAQTLFGGIIFRCIPVYHIVQRGCKNAGKDVRLKLAAAGLCTVQQDESMRPVGGEQQQIAWDERELPLPGKKFSAAAQHEHELVKPVPMQRRA